MFFQSELKELYHLTPLVMIICGTCFSAERIEKKLFPPNPKGRNKKFDYTNCKIYTNSCYSFEG